MVIAAVDLEERSDWLRCDYRTVAVRELVRIAQAFAATHCEVQGCRRIHAALSLLTHWCQEASPSVDQGRIRHNPRAGVEHGRVNLPVGRSLADARGGLGRGEGLRDVQVNKDKTVHTHKCVI